jgi:hypothetical protein
VRVAVAVAVCVLSTAAAELASARSAASCSASKLSPAVPTQKLPAPVAALRRRIVALAVRCDYAGLAKLAGPKFSFSFGGERSAAAYWKQQEAKGGRPLAILVKILKLPFTHNETGAYAWPRAYQTHPTRADWDALVRVGVLTRKAAHAMRKGGNVYYGYRTAITKSGRWQFFLAGD